MLGQRMDLSAATSNGDLTELARRFGTDKVPKCPTYELYLASIRQRPINLLEIGIGGYDDPRAGGASLRMWKAYFPQAKIHGLDMYDKSAHAEDRIRVFQGSQDDPDVLKRIAFEMGSVDAVIDDGSHVSAHIIRSFEILFPILARGGIYIVEDIGTSYWPDYGGSEDFSNPNTSMAYFKRLADGIQYRHFRHKFDPTYADVNTEFVHFYDNIIIMRKR